MKAESLEQYLVKDSCPLKDDSAGIALNSTKCGEVSLPNDSCFPEDHSKRETRVPDDGGIEVIMEDSEISGASTLLKMQHSTDESFRGFGHVLAAIDQNTINHEKTHDISENSKPLLVDESCRFVDGDFVWGKIKSHPWWPGRVYNPSHASELATKIKQKGKILVTYFGDGTFAWCHPSQLKHLEDDFHEMLKQNTSKSFLNAVECLLDEFEKLLVIKVSCSCVPLPALCRPLTDNFGVEEGVVIPENGVEKYCNSFNPSHCMFFLKHSAPMHGSCDLIELTVIKGWLSVFFLINGGRHLPTYHDPQSIPGLDEEEVIEATDTRSPHNFPMLSDDRVTQRRKQKSMADIIGAKQNRVLRRKNRNCNNDDEKDDSSSESQKLINVADAAELADKGASCRRRKKSKYLSAPFTSDSRGEEIKAGELENSAFVCEREDENGVKLERGILINVGDKLNDLKSRLESMTALLENSDEISSQNVKISLQDSLRDAIERVVDLSRDFQQS